MKCPKCSREQPESVECIYCGVVFAKLHNRREPAPSPEPPTQVERPRPPSPAGPAAPRFAAKTASMPLSVRVLNFLSPPIRARRDFYTSLTRLLASGVSITDGMKTIADTSAGRLKSMSAQTMERVQNGSTLASALESTGFFPPLHLSLIEASEQTGHLPPGLEELAQLEEATLAGGRKLLLNLAYPMIVLVLSCLILPVPTLVLGGTDKYVGEVVSRLSTLVSLIALAWLVWRTLVTFSSGLSRFFPGALERKLFPRRRALFFLILKIGLTSGLSIKRALELGARIWSSAANRDLTHDAVRALDRGETLTTALTPLTERKHIIIVATGEQAGELEESFRDIQQELDETAAARGKVVSMVVSALMGLVLLALVASQIFSSFQQSTGGQLEQFEQDIMHETRGIQNRQ